MPMPGEVALPAQGDQVGEDVVARVAVDVVDVGGGLPAAGRGADPALAPERLAA
jgi:hypothetical protein